jgi:drug/metabolite transporter (DMT)-like permease
MINLRPATRRAAVLLLLFCALLWSSAGVITRHVTDVEGMELTFWRSFFCALTLLPILALHERGNPLRPVLAMGWTGLASGLMWAVMFTCFMIAIARTSVANVLLVVGLAPFLAAVAAWLVLRERIGRTTWVAIALAALGVWWMVREGVSTDGLQGMLIALGVPLASATNLVMLRKMGAKLDLAPAVLVGALLSCAISLPFAWPFNAGAYDLLLLAILGAFQLALPCWLMVGAANRLAPHEVALIALLEVVLGPLWTWLGAGEALPMATLQGGVVIIAALVGNAMLQPRRAVVT